MASSITLSSLSKIDPFKTRSSAATALESHEKTRALNYGANEKVSNTNINSEDSLASVTASGSNAARGALLNSTQRISSNPNLTAGLKTDSELKGNQGDASRASSITNISSEALARLKKEQEQEQAGDVRLQKQETCDCKSRPRIVKIH